MRKIMQWMVAATLTSSLFVWTSCSNDDNAVIPQPGHETEFGALLKTLDWGTDTCFVYGHKTPDVDAVTSALSYARLMRLMGYNCKAKVSSGMNRETAYIARVFGFALPELKSSVVPQTRLILTDHTDYAQCVEGAREAVVLQKIDHHVEGDIADSGIPFVRREMVGSTNSIIYEMYKEQGITIDDETARIMLAVMPEVMGQRGRQMLVAKIDNMVENTGDDRAERPYVENGTYFIYYGEGAKQVAEGVIGPSLREGVCYTSEKLSRKQIVPRITEVLTGN